MHFFRDFLKINQEKDVSFKAFISDYDLQKGTNFKSTLHYDKAMMKMMKDLALDFFNELKYENTENVWHDISEISTHYVAFLMRNRINEGVRKVLQHLISNSPKHYFGYRYFMVEKFFQNVAFKKDVRPGEIKLAIHMYTKKIVEQAIIGLIDPSPRIDDIASEEDTRQINLTFNQIWERFE